MNPSHQSNMGTLFSSLNGDDFNEEDNEDNEKESCLYHESSPEIKILIIYEQPQGTGLHMTLTLDPRITTEALKKDLSNVTSVPVGCIILIHQNIILENDKSLLSQGVQPNNTIVLRDNRLTYNFP